MTDSGSTASDMMAAYAEDAVDHARVNFSVALDYSPESVREVERILEQLRVAMRGFIVRLFRLGPSDDDVRKMSMMYGGYVGEVFKRVRGGDWTIHSEHGLALVRGEEVIFPHERVHKRLVNGAEDDVWSYFQIIANSQNDA